MIVNISSHIYPKAYWLASNAGVRIMMKTIDLKSVDASLAQH